MYFETYQDVQRLWRWRLRAANHEIIAHGESYVNKYDCLAAVNLVKNTNTNTPVT